MAFQIVFFRFANHWFKIVGWTWFTATWHRHQFSQAAKPAKMLYQLCAGCLRMHPKCACPMAHGSTES